MKKLIYGFANENNVRTTEWKIFECSGTVEGQSTAFSLLTYGAYPGVVGFTIKKNENNHE